VEWRFEKVGLKVPKCGHIVAKFGKSVDDSKTQLFQVQIFDICPETFWHPFEFFVTITANGTENFKRP